MNRFSPVRSRLLTSLMAVMAVVGFSTLHAQTTTTTTCESYFVPCAVAGGGSIIIGGYTGAPSVVSSNSAGNYGGDENIFGSGNSIFDANTATDVDGNGVEKALGSSQIFGTFNSLSAKNDRNSITGYNNAASGDLGNLTINGVNNTVTSNDGNITITGTGNLVTGSQGLNWGLTVMGGSNTITTSSGTINGTANTVTDALESSVTGDRNTLSGDYNSVTGVGNALTGSNSAIVGSNSSATGLNGAMIVGSNSHLGADATGSIILGSDTTTDTPNQAAFGGRTLGQIGNGVADDDGVAVNQLYGFADALGGGSSFNGGVFTAPNYLLDQYDFNDVGSALTYLDGRINDITIPPPINPPPPPITPPPVSSTDPDAVHYDAGSNDASVTLQGANGTTITNLAPGEVSAASTQAINGSQLYAAEQTAKAYTDTQVQAGENWAKAYTDAQIKKLNQRFDTTQAMATAQTQMVATFAGQDPAHHNRVAAGVGFAGGHNGIAVGYQHTSPTGRFAWNIGAAAAGRDRTIGVGFGTSW